MNLKIEYFPELFRGDFIGDRKFKTVKPFVYHSDIVGTITVPVDFVTDGGSIPPPLYPIIGSPWGGKYAEICIIHDYLSVTKKFSRIMTQKIFLEGLNVLGVPWWKKPVMYAGVRVYSWISWRKYVAMVILLCALSLIGCAFSGKGYFIGMGKHEVEYYPDGSVKKELMESKTPLEDVINIQGVKAN